MQTELRDGTLHISGDITVKTLTATAFTRFRQQCRLKDTRAVDLSGVGRADSACVSLLLDALRRPDGKITLQGIPESVRTLSELYEIKDWLNP
ncbi:STAS domain-containing protein [Neisseria sicca]|uniref:STAS domain-containing protein n=1 Tax=Neisseria sicca TaxID=490 RepID=UPI000D2FBFAE|nr:lipid asymmetry maintenance protein MlaB [Neisseria sicca]